MFEQDYLMKLLLAFYQAMFKSLRRVTDEDEDPKEAADTLEYLYIIFTLYAYNLL